MKQRRNQENSIMDAFLLYGHFDTMRRDSNDSDLKFQIPYSQLLLSMTIHNFLLKCINADLEGIFIRLEIFTSLLSISNMSQHRVRTST